MGDSDKSTVRASGVCQRAIAIADSPEIFSGSKVTQAFRGELEQLKYKVNVRLEKMSFKRSMIVAVSSYINECLGTEVSILEVRGRKASPNQLTVSSPSELLNLKVIAACCGDFHTLVLTKGCVLAPDSKDEQTDVYGFGQNVYGQVTGNSLKKEVVKPELVPFFIGREVRLIDAKGSRSVAVTAAGEIYEWGFPEVKARKTGYLEAIESMKIGLTFNLYLTKSEECYIHGRLTDMDGDSIVEYDKPSFIGVVWKVEEKKFVQIATGYTHAVLLSKSGKVYVWGIGKNGQLGMTSDVRNLFDPYPIENLCSESGRILKVFATANHSFAQSDLGIVYHWGLMEAAKQDVIWTPEICHADDSAQVLDVGGLQHEIIIMDTSGRLSICKLTQSSREFRPMVVPFGADFRKIGGCGIGHQVFIKPFLVPELCPFELSSTVWTTGRWSSGKLRLFSNVGPYPVASVEDVRISLFFSASVADKIPSHDYQTYCANVVEKAEKVAESNSVIRTYKKLPHKNDVTFDCQLRVSELDENELVLDFCAKEGVGKFYLHVLVAEEYVAAPVCVEIQQGSVDQPKGNDEIRRKAVLDRMREAEEKKRKLEEELRLKREREAAEEQRRRLTAKRAEEALKQLKMKIKEDEKKLIEERKKRKELITGGGFDLSKLAKKE